MQFFTRPSRITQSKSYVLLSIDCVWDFQNNALWDTHWGQEHWQALSVSEPGYIKALVIDDYRHFLFPG